MQFAEKYVSRVILFSCSFLVSVSWGYQNSFSQGQTKTVGHSGSCPKSCELCSKVVEKALHFIAARQNKDGSWGENGHHPPQFFHTSLCGLALLASGSTPGKGKFKAELDQAVKAVTKQTEEAISGFKALQGAPFCNVKQAIPLGLVIFLAHAYEKDKSDKLKELLEKLCNLLVGEQAPDGGWSYCKKSSVTREHPGMTYITNGALVSLLLCRAVGVKVEDKILRRVREFYTQKALMGDDGRLRYFPSDTHDWGDVGRTAGALWPMRLVDLTKTETFNKAEAYLEKHIKDFPLSHHGPGLHILYSGLSCFYSKNDKLWKTYSAYFETISKSQKDDGRIVLERTAGHHECELEQTAYCAVILQLHLGNLLFDKLHAVAGNVKE